MVAMLLTIILATTVNIPRIHTSVADLLALLFRRLEHRFLLFLQDQIMGDMPQQVNLLTKTGIQITGGNLSQVNPQSREISLRTN